MGYYHGYKGYRYCSRPSSLLPYKDFNELQAVYNFDMQIKAILYPQIMSLETTLKNYVLEAVLSEAKSDKFSYIYSKLLTDYKSYPNGTKRKERIIKRLTLRDTIYGNISKSYGKNNIVNHYYDKDKLVPIWGIFELLTLGQFGSFVSCLNLSVRKRISNEVGIKSNVDSDGRMLEKIIYILKDLRNAVAHNSTVFDTRFKTGNIDSRISKYINTEISISSVDFNSIVDYIILISFLLKILQYNENEITEFICQFEKACENLRNEIPIEIYSKIVYTNTKSKITAVKLFTQK